MSINKGLVKVMARTHIPSTALAQTGGVLTKAVVPATSILHAATTNVAKSAATFSRLAKTTKPSQIATKTTNAGKVIKHSSKKMMQTLDDFRTQHFDKLHRKLTSRQAQHIVKNDEMLTEFVSNLERKIQNSSSSKRLIGLSASIVLTGLGGGAVWSVLTRYKEEMTGCFRYEIKPDGSVDTCKVLRLSCNAGAKPPAGHTKMCHNALLTPNQLTGKCPINTNNQNLPSAFKCNSQSTDPNDVNYIADANTLPSNVYFRCVDATYADAMADLSVNVTELVKTAAVGTASIVKYVISTVLTVVVIGTLITLWIFFKKMKKDIEGEEDDDTQKLLPNHNKIKPQPYKHSLKQRR